MKLSRPLAAGERETLTDVGHDILGYPFEVGIIQVDEVERSPTGKFEEFVSSIETAPLRE